VGHVISPAPIEAREITKSTSSYLFLDKHFSSFKGSGPCPCDNRVQALIWYDPYWFEWNLAITDHNLHTVNG
jgi:hypothetical protein